MRWRGANSELESSAHKWIPTHKTGRHLPAPPTIADDKLPMTQTTPSPTAAICTAATCNTARATSTATATTAIVVKCSFDFSILFVALVLARFISFISIFSNNNDGNKVGRDPPTSPLFPFPARDQWQFAIHWPFMTPSLVVPVVFSRCCRLEL